MPYDIEMTTDDTLELDTIIKESSIASNPINKIDTDANYNIDDIKGIQTHTGIFDPSESGEYDIHINGQVLSINVTDASAIPEIELFNDGDFSEWSVGDGEMFTQTTGTYVEGGSAAEGTEKDKIFSDSGDGLNYYPGVGDRYILSSYFGGNAVYVYCAFASESSHYRIDANAGDFDLVKKGDGGDSDITVNNSSTSYTHTNNEWYDIEIERYSNGDINCYLYDGADGSFEPNGSPIAFIQATDSQHHTEEGIQLNSRLGNNKFDYLRAKSL